MRGWLLLVAGCAACYKGSPPDSCAISCATSQCPAGLACGADQRCYPQGGAQCQTSLADAAMEECYGHGLINICVPHQTMDVTLPGGRFATDACAMIIPGGGCLIVGRTITVNSPTSASGSLPLILLGTEDVTISGRLDVSSSTMGGYTGAGALATCATGLDGMIGAGPVGNGAGGGAGGTNGGLGGSGGTTNGEAGGTASSVVSPLGVNSGCPGGAGGAPGGAGASGGAGGGAVYVMSGGMLTVTGTIDASGAGGSGAPLETGGAGGGAGGFIGLDAPSYNVTGGTVFAIGGGGSCGGGVLAPSVDGAEASGPNSGGGNSCPGFGGTAGAGGSTNASSGGSGGNNSGTWGGGGGGGGGGGYIAVANVALLGAGVIATYAPQPINMP